MSGMNVSAWLRFSPFRGSLGLVSFHPKHLKMSSVLARNQWIEFYLQKAIFRRCTILWLCLFISFGSDPLLLFTSFLCHIFIFRANRKPLSVRGTNSSEPSQIHDAFARARVVSFRLGETTRIFVCFTQNKGFPTMVERCQNKSPSM